MADDEAIGFTITSIESEFQSSSGIALLANIGWLVALEYLLQVKIYCHNTVLYGYQID